MITLSGIVDRHSDCMLGFHVKYELRRWCWSQACVCSLIPRMLGALSRYLFPRRFLLAALLTRVSYDCLKLTCPWIYCESLLLILPCRVPAIVTRDIIIITMHGVRGYVCTSERYDDLIHLRRFRGGPPILTHWTGKWIETLLHAGKTAVYFLFSRMNYSGDIISALYIVYCIVSISRTRKSEKCMRCVAWESFV